MKFPRSLLEEGGLDFSFSGLKTAVLYHVRGQDARPRPVELPAPVVADICASFEQAVVDVLVAKALAACRQVGARGLAVVGGVAANTRLRRDLMRQAATQQIRVVIPPVVLCTDNAAFIAGHAWNHFRVGEFAPPDADAIPHVL